MGGGAIGLSAAIAPTPKLLLASVTGAWSTAPAELEGPLTAAPYGEIKPPSKYATDDTQAFDEPAVLTAQDIELQADRPAGGHA